MHAPARCRLVLAGPAACLEEFGLGVVGKVVAPDFVLVAMHHRLLEKFHAVDFAVVFHVLRDAVDPFVHAVPLLPEGDGVAVGRRVFEPVGVFPHGHVVGREPDGALGQDDFSFEIGDLLGVVRRQLVGLDVDRLVAVAPLCVGRQAAGGEQQDGGVKGGAAAAGR